MKCVSRIDRSIWRQQPTQTERPTGSVIIKGWPRSETTLWRPGPSHMTRTMTASFSAASGREQREAISPVAANQNQTKNERIVMNDKFDELAKGLAQSVTRRGALKKFALGLTGIALASLSPPNTVHAGRGGQSKTFGKCQADPQTGTLTGTCIYATAGGDLGCRSGYSPDCVGLPKNVVSDAEYFY